MEEVFQLVFGTSRPVVVGGDAIPLSEALTHRLELSLNSGAFLSAYSQLVDYEELANALLNDKERQALLIDYQVIDVLRQWPYVSGAAKAAGVSDTTETLEAGVVSSAPNALNEDFTQAFVDTLRPLSPRVYSIASSSEVAPDEVHITVAQVSYESFGLPHAGVASTTLTQSIEAGEHLPVYIDANPRFRLPENPATDIIMIGPGTGVAPFRAFVQHRAETGATGRNWLFFGDRNFDEDFLYQLEWQKYLKQNMLHRLDLAFSRDQQQKIYVQDRLLENAEDIYAWITAGASVFVCGDATSMAPDVHTALRTIVATQGNQTEDEAEVYLKTLKRERRYLRDVY